MTNENSEPEPGGINGTIASLPIPLIANLPSPKCLGLVLISASPLSVNLPPPISPYWK